MKRIPDQPNFASARPVSINRPIIQENFVPLADNQGYLFARVGFRATARDWSWVNESEGANYAWTDSTEYSFLNGAGFAGFDAYYGLQSWQPVVRPIRRAHESLEYPDVVYNTKQLDLTDGFFFLLFTVVGHSHIGGDGGTCRFRIYELINDEAPGALVQELEIFVPDGAQGVVCQQVVALELDVITTERTGFFVVYDWKLGAGYDGGQLRVWHTSIMEAPLVNPWTYHTRGAWVAYGSEWVSDVTPVPLWEDDGLEPLVLSGTAPALVLDGRRVGLSTINKVAADTLFSATRVGRPDSLYASVSCKIVDTAVPRCVLAVRSNVGDFLSVVRTSSATYIEWLDDTTATITNFSPNIAIDTWTDVAVSIVPHPNGSVGGHQLSLFIDHELILQRDISVFLSAGITELTCHVGGNGGAEPWLGELALPLFVLGGLGNLLDVLLLNETFRRLMVT